MTWKWASDNVASNVRFLRQQRRWTAADLAERCAAAGYPQITRSVIANIETGRPREGERRRFVTVDELAAFATVLERSVFELMFGEVDVAVENAQRTLRDGTQPDYGGRR